MASCGQCGGQGTYAGRCLTCGGTRRNGQGGMCLGCLGSGVNTRSCQSCRGTGQR